MAEESIQSITEGIKAPKPLDLCQPKPVAVPLAPKAVIQNSEFTIQNSPAPSPQSLTPYELGPVNVRLVFTLRGRQLVHVLARPQTKDWLDWARAVTTTYQTRGDTLTAETSGELEAYQTLWRKQAVRVEGYASKDGRALLEAYPETWRDFVPVAHMEVAIRLLARVQLKSPEAASSSEAFIVDLDLVPVEIEVTDQETAPLVHWFRAPGMPEQKTYKRIMAESRLVTGSKHLKTVIGSRLPALVKLYDELIERVEGYTLDGQSIEQKKVAQRSMDAIHKQVAVQGLFESPEEQEQGVGAGD